ncbi:MAG: hypothetical protein JWM78_1362 [Verrucomicrobiaceae bacterium]|nr:hypothetical protein [Verrucomicrobiaceae bacterium]
MTDTSASSVYDPVVIARNLRPLLEQYAAETEQQRRVPQPVIEALETSGLFRMMFPRRADGPACSVITHLETIAELAKACPGTAWAFGLLSGVTGSAAGFPPAMTELLFKRGDERFCSATSLTAKAVRVAGGYRVTGSWGYGSGCMHADWALNGILVVDGTGNTVDQGLALIPLRDEAVTINDTWNVLGVLGSGSNTIVADNVFVPDALAMLNSQMPSRAMLLQMPGLEPRDLWPMEPRFPLGVLAPMLGAAEALLERVSAAMPKRSVVGWGYDNQADSENLVGQLGEAALEIDSAWLHIRRAAAYLDETSPQRELSGFEKARIQADSGYAMALLRRAGDRLMDIAGPSAFATTNPLQRFWRDLSFGSRHNAMNSRLSIELYGRALLGQPSNIALLPDISRHT